MTSTETVKNILHYVPSNRGYIVNGKKFYGNQTSVDKASNMKLLSDDRHVHSWMRFGYVETVLEKNETDCDGFTCVKRGRKLVTSRPMRPCRVENGGKCENIDPEHRKFFYHFTKYIDGNPVVRDDGKILCKYRKSGDWKCWEAQNGEHCNNFYHA